ncbi:hypothetical protein PWT90_02652 [Aphanocladium album]|nr:hypothetical protein PWT90_02652 [Aphanocladium album]
MHYNVFCRFRSVHRETTTPSLSRTETIAVAQWVVQVTGNIQAGMMFEVKTNNCPESSPEFFKKEYLGWVSPEDLHRVQQVCAAIPPPKKQFEGPKSLYPAEPLRRCQEWTKEAIAALVAQDVLRIESQS